MDLDPKVKTSLETYLQGLFSTVGETAQFTLNPTEDGLFIDLQGARIFIGEDQRALHSLAYLLEIYLRRTLHAEVRIVLDADGYRQRRREELRLQALQLAEQVIRERKRVRLNPMEAYERKAIHEALQDYPGVSTHSEGPSEERRVIIEPTDLGPSAPR
jgi:spoIIIJ-associated protein